MTFGSKCRSMIAIGWRPMTRAACTYSLFFSTSVEPRTVRAYCTQPEMPIARIRTGIAISIVPVAGQHDARHPVDQQRDQDRGKESCTSAMRMMTASSLPPT